MNTKTISRIIARLFPASVHLIREEVKDRYRELHKTSLSECFSALLPQTDDSAEFHQLLQTILTQLVKPGDPERDNESLLTDYIEQEYQAHQQRVSDYADNWENNEEGTAEYLEPAPSENLWGAVAMLAVLKRVPYQQLACECYNLQKYSERLELANEFLDQVNGRVKKGFDQAAKNAEQAIKIANDNHQLAMMYKTAIGKN